MKPRHLLIVALVGLLALASACKGDKENKTDSTAEEMDAINGQLQTVGAAIDSFLVDSIGQAYGTGRYCIPYSLIVEIDESNPDDILAWGSYKVYNYDLSGDTLKTVSGGHHPGLMHVRRVGGNYEVLAFDPVGDGASFTPTAKKIFGERYDAFVKVCGNDSLDNATREKTLADFVLRNRVPASLYQDFGWPAKTIPVK